MSRSAEDWNTTGRSGMISDPIEKCSSQDFVESVNVSKKLIYTKYSLDMI